MKGQWVKVGPTQQPYCEIVRLCEQLVSLLRDNREPGLLTWQMFRGQRAEALYKKLGEVLYGGA